MISVHRSPVTRSPVTRQQVAVMSALVLLTACRSPGTIRGWGKAASPPSTVATTAAISTETSSAATNSAATNSSTAIPTGSSLPPDLAIRHDSIQPEQPVAPKADADFSASPVSASPVSANTIAANTLPPQQLAVSALTTYAAMDRQAAAGTVPGAETAGKQVAIPSPSAANEPSARLVISGVRPSRGPVKVAIYASEQSFTAMTNPIRTLQMVANLATIETTLPLSGRVAVAVYQDINADGELNRNRFGIPIEPFAFSNKAMGERGPPSFEQAAVVIPAESASPITIYIQLP